MKGLLDKIGPAGSVITALCCLGFPALISLLTAIGAALVFSGVWIHPVVVGLGIVGLIASPVWSIKLLKRRGQSRSWAI